MPIFPPVIAQNASPKTRQNILDLAARWNKEGHLNMIPPVIYCGTWNPDRKLIEFNYKTNEVINSRSGHWWLIMIPTFDKITVGCHVNIWTKRKNREYGRVTDINLDDQTITVALNLVEPVSQTVHISKVFAVVNPYMNEE